MIVTRNTGKEVILWIAVLALFISPALDFAAENDPVEENPTNPNPTQRLIIPVKDQSHEQQLSDQWDCYHWTCEQVGWDPYQAYTDLVDAGYAVVLTPKELEEGLICLAMDGAVTGAVAGEILGEPEEGAEIGAAIAIASGLIRSGYLKNADSPESQRAVSWFERNLRKWDRKYAGCLSRKGYRVPPR